MVNFSFSNLAAGVGIGMLILYSINSLLESGNTIVPPYYDVDVQEVVRGEGYYDLHATFRKAQRPGHGECELETFQPVGIYLGEAERLRVEDLDGLDENDNREAGLQSLSVRIFYEGEPEVVEVRTRHRCPHNGDRVLVTKVFTIIDTILD